MAAMRLPNYPIFNKNYTDIESLLPIDMYVIYFNDENIIYYSEVKTSEQSKVAVSSSILPTHFVSKSESSKSLTDILKDGVSFFKSINLFE